MGQACTAPIKPVNFTPIFVSQSKAMKIGQRCNEVSRATNSCMLVPQSVPFTRLEFDLPYFLTHFLPMNLFIGHKVPVGPKLAELITTSPALVDAIQAVAVLHRKQLSCGSGHPPATDALQAYGRSVRCMQIQITSGTYLDDSAALWTTFLLGLFEV